NPLPTVSRPSDAAICAGEEITLTATGTADSYSWDNGVTNGIAFAPTATATYTVTATIAATGCEAMGQVTVTVNPLPTVTAPDDFSTCEGTEVTLTATGNADDYSWDNSVTNGVAFTPTTTATYIVTGTISATGCRSTDEVTVTLNTIPTAIISTDREDVCENETVDVTITATTTATTLQWLFNGTPIDGATELTYTATAFGDYTLSASKDGCDCTSNTITIAPTAAPVTSLPTEQVTITTADEITLDAGSGFITYLWDNSSNEQTRLVDGTTLEPNTYIYWVEVTNEAGCLTRDTVEVKVDPYQSVTTANGLAVELYPNPTKGVVKIKIDNANGDATISIYSQTGQLISKKQSAVQGKEIADEVDLSNLTKGVYIIQVTTKNQRLTKLVVLE
ncbi:MAG TPA: T9SS type A sorting domain-containing protein, partial [Tenuifilaceae bacterium]|nr:T9SS type A sorting domain-containing protein [Tenuifilaceae bacterium]